MQFVQQPSYGCFGRCKAAPLLSPDSCKQTLSALLLYPVLVCGPIACAAAHAASPATLHQLSWAYLAGSIL